MYKGLRLLLHQYDSKWTVSEWGLAVEWRYSSPAFGSYFTYDAVIFCLLSAWLALPSCHTFSQSSLQKTGSKFCVTEVITLYAEAVGVSIARVRNLYSSAYNCGQCRIVRTRFFKKS